VRRVRLRVKLRAISARIYTVHQRTVWTTKTRVLKTTTADRKTLRDTIASAI
jgi:hypothetical protein